MSNSDSFKQLHNVLWASHGAITCISAIIFIILEAPFQRALVEFPIDSPYLSSLVGLIAIVFTHKWHALLYGLSCLFMIYAYQHKPSIFRIPMFVFIFAHLPLSLGLNWEILAALTTKDGTYVLILCSLILSELSLIAALCASWICIAKHKAE